MPRLTFTNNLQRHVRCPPADLLGTTVLEVLNAFFANNPLARGYVLDDQGALRKHMLIFINGQQIVDRTGLSDRVPTDGEVYVMQALSGGLYNPGQD
jgi:molybdopterin synthase sulfur carrier subunit